jgi:ribosomal protein L37AE/L43A
MKTKRDDARKNEVRVELKYCERCGTLWMRECGSGIIYCNGCQTDVTELPMLKKKPQTVKLGMGQRPAIDDFTFDASEEQSPKRTRGGAA